MWLRTSIDQIRLADSRLAQQGPRDVCLSLLTNRNVDGSDGNREGMVPFIDFGDLVFLRRKLWDDREKLIAQIRALPGSDTFLEATLLRHSSLFCMSWTCTHQP